MGSKGKKGNKYRYPHDLDKFKGDPAGEGGGYINPTHLRLPQPDRSGFATGEGTCRLCHGRTYQPVQSRLAQGDPPWHRCENCGLEEDYDHPTSIRDERYFKTYKVKRNGDKTIMTDERNMAMSPKEQERLGLNKKYKERGR